MIRLLRLNLNEGVLAVADFALSQLSRRAGAMFGSFGRCYVGDDVSEHQDGQTRSTFVIAVAGTEPRESREGWIRGRHHDAAVRVPRFIGVATNVCALVIVEQNDGGSGSPVCQLTTLPCGGSLRVS
jgi:hypothetical protein